MEKVLREAAAGELQHMRTRAAVAQRELAEIDRKRRSYQEAIDEAASAGGRLDRYQTRAGPDYACPRCWMREGKQSSMRAVAHPQPQSYDRMVCNVCNTTIDGATGR